jgi:dGTPase
MVCDIIEASWAATGEVPCDRMPVITMSPRVRRVANILREFLFERVYIPLGRMEESQRAREVLHLLYRHFCQNPQEIPGDYWIRGEDVERVVVDYIAGMTDNFALRTAERIRPGITRGAFLWRV